MLQFLVKGTQHSFLCSVNCLWVCLFSRSSALSVLCQLDLTCEGRSLLFISASCRSFLLGSAFASSLLMVDQKDKCWRWKKESSYSETRIILRVHWMERPEKGSALDLPYLVGFYYPTPGLGPGGKQGRDSFLSWILNLSVRHIQQFQRENSSLKCPKQTTKKLELLSSHFSFDLIHTCYSQKET